MVRMISKTNCGDTMWNLNWVVISSKKNWGYNSTFRSVSSDRPQENECLSHVFISTTAKLRLQVLKGTLSHNSRNMVQGEPWELHRFFYYFWLARSNLRQENEEVWRCSSLSSTARIMCWMGRCSDWCLVWCVVIGCHRSIVCVGCRLYVSWGVSVDCGVWVLMDGMIECCMKASNLKSSLLHNSYRAWAAVEGQGSDSASRLDGRSTRVVALHSRA